MISNGRDGSIPFPGTKPQPIAGFFSFMYFVYILYSKEFDRYYVGQCEDLFARLTRHNAGAVLSTKAYRPWEIVYSESYPTRSAATIREKEIKKKKSRKYIAYLLSQK